MSRSQFPQGAQFVFLPAFQLFFHGIPHRYKRKPLSKRHLDSGCVMAPQESGRKKGPVLSVFPFEVATWNGRRDTRLDLARPAWLLSRQLGLYDELNERKFNPLVERHLDGNGLVASGTIGGDDHSPMVAPPIEMSTRNVADCSGVCHASNAIMRRCCKSSTSVLSHSLRHS